MAVREPASTAGQVHGGRPAPARARRHAARARERRDDIPPLLDHFLARFAAANAKQIRGVTPAARDALLRYDWPGNVRELENVVERAVVLTRDDVHGTLHTVRGY